MLPIPRSCILTAKISTATIYSTALTTIITVTTDVSEISPLESLRVQAKSSHDIPQWSLVYPSAPLSMAAGEGEW